MALPEDEIRRLVLQITAREDIELFVRRMVILMDALRVGRTSEVARVARQSKDPAFALLMSAMSVAVKDGRILAAHHTAFWAAHCAYSNSLDYLCKLMSYLDRLRDKNCAFR
jgi:hypothetical protein